MRLLDYETSFGALGASLGSSWSLFDSSWGLFGGSWKGLGSSSGALGDGLGSSSGALQDVFSLRGSGEPLFFKNERFVSTGAPFSKPVRARTGSELLRERMLSLGMKRELGRESEKTRREAK